VTEVAVSGVVEPGSSVGKFQIIEGYLPISPNKCMTCGKYHGTFIDFGFNDDWYGAVYFCSDCVTDMATQLGFASPSQRRALISSNQIHLEKRHQLEEELKRYKDAVDALGSLGINVAIPGISDAPPVEVVSNQGAEQLEIDFESTGDNSGSVKSDDVQGSPSVRNNDSLDEFLDTI
jgi:hypothetical protein